MDDDDFMIIGAKKKKEIKNDDKHPLNSCIENFKKFIINPDNSQPSIKQLTEIGSNGEVDKNFIRPSIWKSFLNVVPFGVNSVKDCNSGKTLEESVKLVAKQRTEYKNKLKGLNALKKFNGDPLGGSNDVSLNLYT